MDTIEGSKLKIVDVLRTIEELKRDYPNDEIHTAIIDTLLFVLPKAERDAYYKKELKNSGLNPAKYTEIRSSNRKDALKKIEISTKASAKCKNKKWKSLDEAKDTIMKMFWVGFSHKQVAESIKCSEAELSYWMSENGFTKESIERDFQKQCDMEYEKEQKSKQKTMNIAELKKHRQAIINMKNLGMSFETIARKYEISTATLLSLWKKHKLYKDPSYSLQKEILNKSKEKIVSLLSTGSSVMDLAKRYNIAYNTIYSWMRAQNIALPKTKHQLLDDQKEQIKRKLSSGRSVKQISVEYNYAESAMYKWMKANGILTPTKQVIARYKLNPLAPVTKLRKKTKGGKAATITYNLNKDKDSILKMLDSGCQVTDITKKYGCSEDSVYSWLKKNNIMFPSERALEKHRIDIIKMLSDKTPLSHIVAKYKVTPAMLTKLRKEHNIQGGEKKEVKYDVNKISKDAMPRLVKYMALIKYLKDMSTLTEKELAEFLGVSEEYISCLFRPTALKYEG